MGRMGQGASVAPKVPDTSAHLEIISAPEGAKGHEGKVLLDAGSLTVPGAYICEFNTTGMNTVAVNLRPSSVTGTFAPTIRTVWLADGSARTTSAGSNFAANTNQELTLSDLKGQRRVQVIFTVPSSGEITFNRAEFNGL